MKSFNQFIKESINQPYSWRMIYSPSDRVIAKINDTISGSPIIWDYSFVTSDGDTIAVDIKYEYRDRSITIGFALDVDGGYIDHLIGAGDSFRVFATVIDIARHFVKTANFTIKKIKFSASKGEGSGRAKLYHRFAKRFGINSGYGKIDIKTYSHDVEYILSKG